DGEVVPVGPGPMSDNPVVLAPAGAVHCSMRDWAKFIAAHVNGPRGRACPIHLARRTWQTLHAAPFGGTYAMGWVVAVRHWAGGEVLTHAGSNTMNYAVVWMTPKLGFAVLVATNQGGTRAAEACDRAAAAMIQRFMPPLPAAPPRRR
ncbi:MAG: serine hydrolase, partial [Planctomycetes bacterium]|nr:serine hydrolase [Planctomycetota bacterium]